MVNDRRRETSIAAAKSRLARGASPRKTPPLADRVVHGGWNDLDSTGVRRPRRMAADLGWGGRLALAATPESRWRRGRRAPGHPAAPR
jgi:hypothetical protein